MIKKVKYLTQAQFDALTAKDADTEYRITDAECITDVKIDGTSIVSGGVATIPEATTSGLGVTKKTLIQFLESGDV